VLDIARQKAGRQAVQNARSLVAQQRRSDVTVQQRARRWWDLPAKYEVANAIADEEMARHVGHHNDHGDALRHAEWSRRMADEVGPTFSMAAGIAHEIEGASRGQPLSEAVMDLNNNIEGVTAANQNRRIDQANLQDRPISMRGAMVDGQNRYDDASPNRTEYPSRPYGTWGSARNGYKDGPPRRSGADRYPAY
jgi:hypothetical protein